MRTPWPAPTSTRASSATGSCNSGGTWSASDALDALRTEPFGVDDSNTAVGSWRDLSGNDHGFIHSGGSLTSFDYPGATSTEAYAVDNAGVVVGSYIPTDSGVYYAYVKDGSTYTTLNVPGATVLTEALGINNAGTVVGAYIGAGSQVHGFIDNGDRTRLSTCRERAAPTCIASITMATWRALTSILAGQHGFVDIGGVITTIDGPGARTTGVYGLNDADVVSGTWLDSNFTDHGFIGTRAPTVPEPTSLALMAIGAAGLLLRRRTRSPQGDQ